MSYDINDNIAAFFPENVVPSNNSNCLRLPIAWALSGRNAEDAPQWLVDVCAYQNIGRDEELAALCTGYYRLAEVFISELKLVSGQEREQMIRMLSVHCKYHLAALEEGAVDFPPLVALPILRDGAAELFFGEGWNETMLYFCALVYCASVHGGLLHDSWLDDMATAQRALFSSPGDLAAETVCMLWQQLMNVLLPQSLQTAAFVENCLYCTAILLSAKYAEEAETWTEVAQSFINTMTIEEK